MRLARLAGREWSAALERCVESLDPDSPADYRELAALLVFDWVESRPRRVGLGGGQGAGKSTLGRLIEQASGFVGLRTCVLSLDDFYRTKRERRRLAAQVHPLFETRGPPGTHDVAMCREALVQLARAESVELPIFDKGRDDRSGTRRVEGPMDLILLEGWCVGAEPVPAVELDVPTNALERDEDRDGSWRRYSNEQLAGPYRELFRELDVLVFLQVPDLAAVRRWRGQQERSLPIDQRLDHAALDRFIEHYERVTRSMLERMPGRADVTVRLAADHSVAGIEFS